MFVRETHLNFFAVYSVWVALIPNAAAEEQDGSDNSGVHPYFRADS